MYKNCIQKIDMLRKDKMTFSLNHDFYIVPNYFRNQQTGFEINLAILTCLKKELFITNLLMDCCIDPNYRKHLDLKNKCLINIFIGIIYKNKENGVHMYIFC